MELLININHQKEFSITKKDDRVLLNHVPHTYKLEKLSPSRFILYLDQKIYDIQLIARLKHGLFIQLNGMMLELTLKDHITQLLEQLGMEAGGPETLDNIRAPMPGAILEVAIRDGQEVKKGDKLLILEAMKMENVIKAPADAKVSVVHVKPGDNVEKNQQLVSF